MWITKKTDYATRAVLALAISHRDHQAVNVPDLAARVAVPAAFLQQIMSQLREAGIVRSERGPSGGYRLNHPPAEISLERIVRLFQGPLAPIACATRTNPEPCAMESGCALQQVWSEVRDRTIEILESTDFAVLASRSTGPWTEAPAPAPRR